MLTKILRTIIALPFLVACEPPTPTCEARLDQKLRAELFDKCLTRAAEARKGTNYTTNDDEDYDDVIDECGTQALRMAYSTEHCRSKP